MSEFLYSFNEGSRNMKGLLGEKGANLAEMTAMGLPVPFGFVVKTEDELFNIADKLFSDSAFYQTTAEAGKKVFEEQQGALEFVLNVLKQET